MDIKFLIIIIAFLNFLLGLVVFWKNKKSKVNITFVVFCWISSLWAVSLYFYEHPVLFSSPTWIKIVYFIVFPATGVLFYFSFIFPTKTIRFSFLSILLYSLISIPFIWILLFTELWVKDVIFESGVYITIVGSGYILPNIFWLLTVLLFFYNLIKKYKIATGIIKMQLKYVFLGFLLFITFTVIVDCFIPLLTGDTKYFWLSPISLLFLLGFIAYAITRYRFMDIRLAIKKGTTHLISIVIILSLYSALIIFTQQTLVQKYNWNSTATTLVAVLIIALSVEPLRRIIIKTINNLIYSKAEKKRIELSERAKKVEEKKKFYSQKTMLTRKADSQIENFISDIIKEYLTFISIDKVSFLAPDPNTKKFECTYPKNKKISLNIKDPLYLYLNKKTEILVTQEIPYIIKEEGSKQGKYLHEVFDFLKKEGIEIVLPIGEKDSILGIFFIGSKSNNKAYSQEDINAFQDFRTTITPILVNMIFYKKGIEGIK